LKRPQGRVILKVATFDAKTPLSEKKLVEMKNDTKEINSDVIGLRKVRRRGKDLETLQARYIFH